MTSFVECVRLICILLILGLVQSNIIPPFGLRRGHDEPSEFFHIRTSDLQDNNEHSQEGSRDDMPTRKNPEFEKAVGEVKDGKHNLSDPGIFSDQDNKDVNYHMLVDEIFDSEKKEKGGTKDDGKEAMVIPNVPNVQKATKQPQEIVSSETTTIQSIILNPSEQQIVVSSPKIKNAKGSLFDMKENGNDVDYIQPSSDDNEMAMSTNNLQKKVTPPNQSQNIKKPVIKVSTESNTATTTAPAQIELNENKFANIHEQLTNSVTSTAEPEMEEHINKKDLQNPIKMAKIVLNKTRTTASSTLPKSSMSSLSSQIKKNPSSIINKDDVQTNILTKSNDEIYDVENQASSFSTKLSDQYDSQIDVMESIQKANGTQDDKDVKSVNDDEGGPLQKIFHILAKENKLGGLKNRTNLINWKIVNHGKQTIIIL
ncbi:unnamed protein product [Lepeophtheirus salmonis]|uniref:(salmon louse) hypothetical protein n=1 Tax=Lepeophtheirus salmonis TaxID=72036 RepID=A0A7R8CZE4_LEPSM|nr:unnamed protein product [Lepeophtheirus salmonis]CAF2933853.1 unnamed protein product [Lepeophtheirus salmonis]